MARLRVEKLQEAIKQEISKILLHDIKDPRIKFVTVTGVELTRYQPGEGLRKPVRQRNPAGGSMAGA